LTGGALPLGRRNDVLFVFVPYRKKPQVLQNAHLLRFPHPSPFNVPESTPHGSGYRGPCIWTFLNSLQQRLYKTLIAMFVKMPLENRAVLGHGI
jgi:hypothetical protein